MASGWPAGMALNRAECRLASCGGRCVVRVEQLLPKRHQGYRDRIFAQPDRGRRDAQVAILGARHGKAPRHQGVEVRGEQRSAH